MEVEEEASETFFFLIFQLWYKLESTTCDLVRTLILIAESEPLVAAVERSSLGGAGAATDEEEEEEQEEESSNRLDGSCCCI